MTKNDSENEEKEQINNSNKTTRIDGSLSGLSLTVETEGKKECKELFNETWDKMLTDAENMSDGLDERMNSL